MQGKRFLKGLLQTVLILLIVLLFLTAAVIFIWPGTFSRNTFISRHLHYPEDTGTKYADTAVITVSRDHYSTENPVLFSTAGGIKSAKIASVGDVCYLQIQDTGEYFAASPKDILGEIVYSDRSLKKVCLFIESSILSSKRKSFLIFSCVLLSAFLMIFFSVRLHSRPRQSTKNAPKIIEEQIGSVSKSQLKNKAAPIDRKKELEAFVHPPLSSGKSPESSSIFRKDAPAPPSLSEEEQVRRLMEQETKIMTFDVPKKNPPETPSRKEEIPGAEDSPVSFDDLEKELALMQKHLEVYLEKKNSDIS